MVVLCALEKLEASSRHLATSGRPVGTNLTLGMLVTKAASAAAAAAVAMSRAGLGEACAYCSGFACYILWLGPQRH